MQSGADYEVSVFGINITQWKSKSKAKITWGSDAIVSTIVFFLLVKGFSVPLHNDCSQLEHLFGKHKSQEHKYCLKQGESKVPSLDLEGFEDN